MHTRTYTADEAAELTGMHPESLRRAARDERLAATKDGQAWRIRHTDLMHYLKGENEWQILARLHVRLNARLSKESTAVMSK